MRARSSALPLAWLLVAIFVVLSVASAGWILYRNQQDWLLGVGHRSTAGSTRARVDETLAWRSERLADGAALLSNDHFVALSHQILKAESPGAAAQEWDQHIGLVLTRRDYVGAALMDDDGRVRHATGAVAREWLQRTWHVTDSPFPVSLSDPAVADGGEECILLTLRLSESGTVVLQLDPAREFAHVLRGRALPMSSMETVLLRSAPGGAIFLGPSGATAPYPVGARLASGTGSIAQHVARGEQGLFDGPNLHGAPAIVGTAPVGNTGWWIVCSISMQAILGQTRADAWRFGIATALAILLAAAVLLLAWHRKQASLYRELYEAEVSRQALAESFDHLTRFANDVIVLADENGVIIEANERAEEMYGYSRGEIIGLPLAKLRAPEIQGQIADDLRQLVAEGNFSYTANHIRKNGDIFPVEVRARHFARGGHSYFHGIIRDVTERVGMVRQLRESEGRFRSIVESNPAGIHLYRLEPDGSLIFEGANPAADRMLGVSHASLVGLRIEDAWPGLAGTGVPDRYRAVCRDGAYWSVEALPYKNGAIDGIFEVQAFQTGANRAAVMFLDITEQQKTREAVRRSEESYRVAAEQTGQLLYDLDTATGRTEWRGAITALTGYTPDEYASVNIAEWTAFVHPEDRPAVEAQWHEALATRSEFRLQYRYRRKDGTYFLAEDHGVFLPAAEKAAPRVLGTLRDVTAWRAAEEDLRQSEMRRQKLESLALLAGGIAHDFNNLLTGIVGNLSLAVHDAAPGSDLRTALEEAERAGLRARDLTRQLLTFSKGGAPIKKVVDLGRLVRETVSFTCRGTAVRSTVRLPDGPVNAEIDEGQIAQVINNIAINAVQAMPEGGTLTASASLVALAPDNALGLPAGQYARVSLSDTGEGIPHGLLGRVFDPYFTTKQQGSGLGLAISHSIVARHAGAIGVKSEVGAGTEFEVFLPAAGRAETARTEVPAAAIGVTGGRVLVMDDEEQVRRLALRMLERLGFEAEGVSDGEEAIARHRQARAEGRPFAVVIMDLTVTGGMGGKEAVRELLADDPAALVIVSSGYSNDPIMGSYADYGFAAVLPKPYRFQQMKDTLARVLSSVQTKARR